MQGITALPAIVKTVLAALLVFGLGGIAPARLLLPASLAPWRVVLVLPLGAACVPLSLTALGLLHVPFSVSLPVVLGAFALAALLSLRRTPTPGAPGAGGSFSARAVVPLLLAALLGLASVTPVLRTTFATVIGQNGDAVLAVGTAELLQHAPPTATRPELPVDRVPLQWRSKVPIYYGLAAVSKVAGQDPVEAFAATSGFVFALIGLGLFLFAVVSLRAPPWVGLAVLAAVPLDRILVYVVIHPYYNQAWGLLALGPLLVFGTLLLREPSRRTFALTALFLCLGLFAYPLMLPFPAVFLTVLALLQWHEARRGGPPVPWAARLRSLGRPRWYVLAPAVIVAVPVVATLGRGVAEKLSGALRALLPGGDLSGWSGPALPYLPFTRFFGLDVAPAVGVPLLIGLFAAAVVGVRGAPRAVQGALGATAATGLFIAAYFYARGQGELFYFKDLGFLGPFVTAAAVVGLAALATRPGLARIARSGAVLALALLAVLLPAGAAREIGETYEYATADLLQLRDWNDRLPAGASVRIDLPPSGYQLWTWYFLADHPVSMLTPLGGFVPTPPFSLKADYVLYPVGATPPDVRSAPLFENATYALARQAPGTPGADLSSQALVDPIKEITLTK